MAKSEQNLGRLVTIHAVQSAYLQRAIFVVVLSFVFFLAMMFTFYWLQTLVYFLLASAFLLVYLITMASWLMQRRNVVKIYENGIEYRKFSVLWTEIETIAPGEPSGLDIRTKLGGKFTLPDTITGLDQIINTVKNEI